MTEAELIQTFQNYIELLDSEIFGYVGVLSGFIVLSYLVADKLTATLTVIVVTLYTFACGILIVRIVLLRRDFSALYGYIMEQKASGAIEVPWFGSNPSWLAEVVSFLIWAVAIGGYTGSIVFFFYQRKGRESGA